MEFSFIQHNNGAMTKEVAKLGKKKINSYQAKGEIFIAEPTGSATQVNLDKQREPDFTERTEQDKKPGQ